jgi:hypothetical protein
VTGTSQAASKAAEIALVRAGPAVVLGIQEVYFWRTLEPSTMGGYDFSDIDTDYKAITGYVSGTGASAVYNAPRRMMVQVFHDYYFSPSPTVAVAPDYIANGLAYGPVGPDGVHNGYWTANGSSGPGTGSVDAIWRPAVMARFIALQQAMAAHVLPDGYTMDTSPYIEATIPLAETADIPSGASDPSYNDTIYSTELQALDVALQAAWPHTNIGMGTNFLMNTGPTYAFELTLPANRVGSSGPDIFGYSSGANVTLGLSGVTWGQAAYIGLKPGSGTQWVSGGTDLRGSVPYIGNVQNTETIQEYGQYYTPADLFQQANTTLHSTHLAWQITSGEPQAGHLSEDVTANWLGTASSLSNWNPATSGGVLATIVNSTLSTTACPSTYVVGCHSSP